MNIMAISGGHLAEGETLAFDRFNVELTGKRAPRALFLPTAAYDSPDYCAAFQAIYEKKLGCRVSFLLLDQQKVTADAVADEIAEADIIYVGGGNTLRMMKVWRRHGVDSLLRAAATSDKVLTGLSAGAICWHDFGHSDSRKTRASDYIRVAALGLTSGIFCPHFDSEPREVDFARVLQRSGSVGFGCDDLTALWCTADGQKHVKSISTTATVKVFTKAQGSLIKQVYRDGETIPRPSPSTYGLGRP